MGEGDSSLAGVLLPVNRAASLRVVVFAIALACLAFVTQGFIWFAEVAVEFDVPGREVVYLLSIVAVLGAVVNGYANDDALVSGCIAVAPIVGFALFSLAVIPLDTSPAVSDTGGLALRLGVLTAIAGSITGLAGVWVGRKYGGGRESPSLE
jgi:hypothetical protein